MALYKLLVASLLVSFVILHLFDADDQLVIIKDIAALIIP
jgi:hypothetical protein